MHNTLACLEDGRYFVEACISRDGIVGLEAPTTSMASQGGDAESLSRVESGRDGGGFFLDRARVQGLYPQFCYGGSGRRTVEQGQEGAAIVSTRPNLNSSPADFDVCRRHGG